MSTRILNALLWMAAAAALTLAAWSGARSFSNPAPSGSIESAVLDQAARLAKGATPYAEPLRNTASAPLPGYSLVLSLLVSGLGAETWVPRALALFALLTLAGLVAWVVWLESQSLTLGLASAALLLAGCGLLADPFGGSGPEALMLIFAIAGGFCVRDVPGALGASFGALLFSAAAFTHPQGIGFALGALLYLAIESRRRLAAYVPALAVCLGGGYVFLSYWFGPWFNYHAWDVPVNSLVFAPSRLMSYAGAQLLGTLGLCCFAALFSFALPVRPWRGQAGIWMCLLMAAVLGGLLASQSGAAPPGLPLSTVRMFAIVGPVALRHITRHLSAWPDSSRVGGQRVLVVALALQFIVLAEQLARPLS
jgi:hypothetical protein